MRPVHAALARRQASSRRPVLARASGALLALATSASLGLAAQSVRGEVVGAVTRRPLAGGLVVLLDTLGRDVARTVTDAAGRFYVRAPAPGSYRLRALRIGYRSWQSTALELTAAGVIDYRIEMPEVPIELAGVTVEVESRCRLGPGRGQGTATLWEEARKALTVTAFTLEHQLYRFRTVSFDRALDPELRVTEEHSSQSIGWSAWPFQSLAAESLGRAGYVQDGPSGPVYYGPDIAVLFSDVFLNGHCFRIEPGPPGDSGAVGLGFEPPRGRRVPDIAGVLWLDRRSAELKYLEFHYTELGHRIPAGQAGGRLDFQRLPSGAWIIRRWWLRAPVPRLGVPGSVPLLHGYREQGGDVVQVLTSAGRPVPLAPDSTP